MSVIFENLANMGDMLKKVKHMQDELKKVQEELKDERYEASAEGVKCVVSGDMEVEDLTISPSLIKGGDDVRISALVKEAVSSAMHEAKGVAKDKLRRVTGGLSIPGLF